MVYLFCFKYFDLYIRVILTNVFRAIVNRKILMDALKVMVNNLFKESFYGKRKKKTINALFECFFYFL